MDMHEGLKIRRGQPRGGSTPPPGTNLEGQRESGFAGLLLAESAVHLIAHECAYRVVL
jgi:hypothetical protein